jgi:hypothetical protein
MGSSRKEGVGIDSSLGTGWNGPGRVPRLAWISTERSRCAHSIDFLLSMLDKRSLFGRVAGESPCLLSSAPSPLPVNKGGSNLMARSMQAVLMYDR